MSRSRSGNALFKKLGVRVRALRQAKGWTQVDMAAHLGIDRGHVSEIENGKRVINLLTLQTVASGLDTTMAKLLKGL
ncbi:MAG TPA: helix-turn-helix transcriptional regulator [Terriglobales bacterium]|nr:helix-turn-helix transcriptional regulator [Terriglobales bacterium]